MALAFACFVALGIASGTLGVAWPSIRAAFGLPLDALAALLMSSTIGIAAGSVLTGQILARISIGRFLLMANLAAGIGLAGYTLAPTWGVIVILGLGAGFGAGSILTGLNVYVADTRPVRTMNWMHAMYGVGAALSPLVMTAILGAGFNWRLGYVFAASIHVILACLYGLFLRHMDFRAVVHALHEDDNLPSRPIPLTITLRLPIVLLSIALFMLYTGVESTAGQWSYSLFTEARAIPAYQAGAMISLFWAMLTVGRLVLGAVADWVGIERLLRGSMIGVVVAAALFLVPTLVGAFAAVALMGLSLSAIFPTLTSDTPNRTGPRHAANAISLQTGAASLGLAVLPGLAGILAARVGLEVVGPFLLISAGLMLLTNEAAIRLAARRAGEDRPAAQSLD
jgi:fucose permease